ncbi:3282_t:CDS:2 [Entrophospora sp. SA101]|nr:3282_t:CDS:2 [Entrophospora sp. SA101]
MLYNNTSNINNSYNNDIKHSETYNTHNDNIYNIEEQLDLSGLDQLANTALCELQNLQRRNEIKMEIENTKETRLDEEMAIMNLELESHSSPSVSTTFGNRISIKDLLSPPSYDECTTVQLYCVCRSSDGQSFMIECDECDEWFHGTCVNITNEEATLIDKYYCPNCTEAKGYKTSWKPEKCKNQNCKKAARFTKSGFCSVKCGLAWNRIILEQEERLAKMESLLNKKKKPLKGRNVQIVTNQKDYSYEFGQPSKIQKISQNGQICGFTPSKDWIVDGDIVEGDDIDEVCKIPKGRCKKHGNWQSFRISQIELMKSNKYESLAQLNEKKRLIKQRMRKRADIDEAFVNETIDHTA